MAFEVVVTAGEVRIDLTGIDRLACWRRSQRFARTEIRHAHVEERGPLETRIQHRAFGYGTHDGAKRPGRRRVGSMLGPTARGPQFWAVEASSPQMAVIVLELVDDHFVRAVLQVEEPEAVVDQLSD